MEANLGLGLPVRPARLLREAAQTLADLGPTTIRLLTNNPKKIHGIEGFGLTVTAQRGADGRGRDSHNVRYLETKRRKLGHTLHSRAVGPEEPITVDRS